mgnify:CR=1 FL=1
MSLTVEGDRTGMTVSDGLDGELSLHCHLGMDGSWRLYARRPPLNHRVRAVLATPRRHAVGQSLHRLGMRLLDALKVPKFNLFSEIFLSSS